jgi:curli biogenesis system outer membrane secretion channel CsgG
MGGLMRATFVAALVIAFTVHTASWAIGPVGTPAPEPTPAQAAQAASPAHPVLKRKVAVGRFTNATLYGKALLIDGERDPLADQASDMLSARLVESGKFLVFERRDLDMVEREQTVSGTSNQNLVGADVLVVGSVTEFGRRVEGKSGFLNSKMRQVATATVEVRLVDVATGRAFFSTKGTGSASVETKEVAGFGSSAGYDSTLNDKAISAAISDLMTNIMQKLEERRWNTDVLQIRGVQILVSGGAAQGLKIGDHLRVETRGEIVKSGQTGLPITLPGDYVATVEILSFFGDDASSEGAITRIVDGRLPTGDVKQFIVVEAK